MRVTPNTIEQKEEKLTLKSVWPAKTSSPLKANSDWTAFSSSPRRLGARLLLETLLPLHKPVFSGLNKLQCPELLLLLPEPGRNRAVHSRWRVPACQLRLTAPEESS